MMEKTYWVVSRTLVFQHLFSKEETMHEKALDIVLRWFLVFVATVAVLLLAWSFGAPSNTIRWTFTGAFVAVETYAFAKKYRVEIHNAAAKLDSLAVRTDP